MVVWLLMPIFLPKIMESLEIVGAAKELDDFAPIGWVIAIIFIAVDIFTISVHSKQISNLREELQFFDRKQLEWRKKGENND